MLASGDVVAAMPEQIGDRVIFRGVYLPRQDPSGGDPIAVVCLDEHATLDGAIACAKSVATVMPLRIVPVDKGMQA